MEEVNVVDRLVEKFGSQAELARAVGVSQPTVWAWKRRGVVPARRIGPLLKKAHELGIQLNAEDLIVGAPG